MKLHHGAMPNWAAIADLDMGWAQAWQNAGFLVLGWGWLEGDMVANADVAVAYCRKYGLDGYIANGESGIEGENFGKSAEFVSRFRQIAPAAPLTLSYIGDGYPYRALDFQSWKNAGAGFMPQCYWATAATSINPSVAAADRAGIPRDELYPTLGTSGFEYPYPASAYRSELAAYGLPSYNVWLLESTTDDYLRALAP